MDSDHRVHVYQTCALTNFAILQLKSNIHHASIQPKSAALWWTCPFRLVELTHCGGLPQPTVQCGCVIAVEPLHWLPYIGFQAEPRGWELCEEEPSDWDPPCEQTHLGSAGHPTAIRHIPFRVRTFSQRPPLKH